MMRLAEQLLCSTRLFCCLLLQAAANGIQGYCQLHLEAAGCKLLRAIPLAGPIIAIVQAIVVVCKKRAAAAS